MPRPRAPSLPHQLIRIPVTLKEQKLDTWACHVPHSLQLSYWFTSVSGASIRIRILKGRGCVCLIHPVSQSQEQCLVCSKYSRCICRKQERKRGSLEKFLKEDKTNQL